MFWHFDVNNQHFYTKFPSFQLPTEGKSEPSEIKISLS